MSRTLYTPDIEPIKDADFLFGYWPWSRGPMWKLQEPWAFAVDNGGFKTDYLIPEGYQFDKASVPPYFWSLGFTPDGLCTVPALEHDFLCDLHHGGSAWLREQLKELPESPPPAVIHKHFHLALLAWGVRSSKAAVMYKGVDWFGPGGKAWPASWCK
jgi:hypothetical protein